MTAVGGGYVMPYHYRIPYFDFLLGTSSTMYHIKSFSYHWVGSSKTCKLGKLQKTRKLPTLKN